MEDLNDDIIECILNFLPIKDVVRMSIALPRISQSMLEPNSGYMWRDLALRDFAVPAFLRRVQLEDQVHRFTLQEQALVSSMKDSQDQLAQEDKLPSDAITRIQDLLDKNTATLCHVRRVLALLTEQLVEVQASACFDSKTSTIDVKQVEQYDLALALHALMTAATTEYNHTNRLASAKDKTRHVISGKSSYQTFREMYRHMYELVRAQDGRVWCLALVSHVGKGYHLSFKQGDILVCEDMGHDEGSRYWTCRHLQTGKQGMVAQSRLKMLYAPDEDNSSEDEDDEQGEEEEV